MYGQVDVEIGKRKENLLFIS